MADTIGPCDSNDTRACCLHNLSVLHGIITKRGCLIGRIRQPLEYVNSVCLFLFTFASVSVLFQQLDCFA